MNENHYYRRGEIYIADLDPSCGSEQGGVRPVVILQNNAGNYFCPTLIVAPITSRIYKKPNQPTHYLLKNVPNLREPSFVLCEQIATIDKRRVRKYVGRIGRRQMDELSEAVRISLGLDETIPEEIEAP